MAARKMLLIITLAALALVLLPLAAGAVAQPDLFEIFTAALNTLVTLTKLAYCSAGISALC